MLDLFTDLERVLPRSAPLVLLNHYLRRYQMEDKIMNRFIFRTAGNGAYVESNQISI